MMRATSSIRPSPPKASGFIGLIETHPGAPSPLWTGRPKTRAPEVRREVVRRLTFTGTCVKQLATARGCLREDPRVPKALAAPGKIGQMLRHTVE